MGVAGRLEGIAPSDIFQIISQSKMTGTLIARSPEGTAMIVFHDGQVIEATSDAPQESLGHILAAQGLVDEGTIAAAQERQKQEPEQPLGAILVRMGALSEKNLEAVVFRQIGHIGHRLMSVDDGFITFDRGETAVKRKLNTREFILPSGVSPEFLIMERARAEDEDRRRGIDRRAADRRAQAPVASSTVWDGVERRRGSVKPASGGNGTVFARLSSRFRAIKLPKAAGLLASVMSVLRKGTEMAVSAAGFFRAKLPSLHGPSLGNVRASTANGTAFIIAGAVAIAAGITLLLFTMYSSRTEMDELLVTGRLVKIRTDPSTSSKVVVKVERGATLSLVSFKDGWYEVRTRAGGTGWVWQNLVERKAAEGQSPVYGMLGCGVLFIAGAALLVPGIMRKQRAGEAPPGVPRSNR